MGRRKVQELMNPDVVCAHAGQTVGDVEKLLAMRGVSGAPVVDDDGRILGVVSQNDLIRHLSQRVTVGESGHFATDVEVYRDIAQLPANRADTPIERIMTTRVFTVGRDASVAVAANIMRERRVHRLLVTDRGRLVGVISALDLMRVVEEQV
jgi:CBS domain-containing protein